VSGLAIPADSYVLIFRCADFATNLSGIPAFKLPAEASEGRVEYIYIFILYCAEKLRELGYFRGQVMRQVAVPIRSPPTYTVECVVGGFQPALIAGSQPFSGWHPPTGWLERRGWFPPFIPFLPTTSCHAHNCWIPTTLDPAIVPWLALALFLP
jgi:hypothetical protein